MQKEVEQMKDKCCEEHGIEFPNNNGLSHHIKEIHYGMKIDEIEKMMWLK